MSQNTHNPYDQDSGASQGDPASNPYMQSRAPDPGPDLDAAAPTLRNDEQQRVNRKALMFLGGIVLLLALMAVLIFANATKKDPVEKPKEEQVSIPTLTDTTAPPLPLQQSASMATPAESIDVQPMPQDSMPPLPAPPPPYAPSGMPPPSSFGAPAAEQRRTPTLLERRMGVEAADLGGGGTQGDAYRQAVAMTRAAMANAPGAPGAPGEEHAESTDNRAKATSARYLRNPDALLVRGTTLRCVLSTRIISDARGFTSCVLTEPVYSINGRTELLARGSKIYGAYQSQPKGNRIEVVWDRVTTPDGIDVNMASPGVDALGSAGVPGYLNSHWASRITSAVMVSLLSDAFKYAAAENGPSTATVSQGVVVVSPFESNTARTLQQIANDVAGRAMSRPPTVTVNQGSVINVYIARDIDFSEVRGH